MHILFTSTVKTELRKGVGISMFPILPVAIGAAAVVLILVIILSYVKAPPDHAYLISGVKKEPRLLVGRAGIRIPFFERLDRLYLGQMSVDIKTDRPVPPMISSMSRWMP